MKNLKSITIKEAIDKIKHNNYLLPSFQRQFVWRPDQIESLFDSLMRDYPIGTFLFWELTHEKMGEFEFFYSFLREYHERDKKYNEEEFSITGQDSVTAILDGQQRLTSLCIGLDGYYAKKSKNKWWTNNDAFPKKKLYLNLLAPYSSNSEHEYDPASLEKRYDFKFLIDEDAKKKSDEFFWFFVGDVLKYKSDDACDEYLKDNKLNEPSAKQADFAGKTLIKLRKVIHDDAPINYFLEKNEPLDRVLNIFARVNKGGKSLSYSELLFSVVTAQWKKGDARQFITELVNELNKMIGDFSFTADFVLKSCLVLSENDIKFKVDNFNMNNIRQIKDNWREISKAIKEAVTLVVDKFRFNHHTLRSKVPLIPIAYYLLLKKCPEKFADKANYKGERDKIFNWLISVLLKQTFSRSPDNILRAMRSIIKKNHEIGLGFPPLNQIVADSTIGRLRSIVFTENEIKDLPKQPYHNRHTFYLLAAVYRTLNWRSDFHKDHIFPRKLFNQEKLLALGISEDKVQFCLENYNTLANLQLLPGTENQEKSAQLPKVWMDATMNEQEQEYYQKTHFIPRDIPLSLDNFEEFIEKRSKLLVEEFSKYLKMPDDGIA